MSSNKNYTGYHSTTIEYADEIILNGFIIPRLDADDDKSKQEKFFKYWLGPGVYFFEDIDVAKWWSSKPSDTFGSVGEHIELKSSLSPKNVLDLRKVSVWKELVKYFDIFCTHVAKNFVTKLPKKIPFNKKSKRYRKYFETKYQLRCIFFTWLISTQQIDMIIAAFNQEEFGYLEKGKYKIEKYLDIFYTEVQYCVYDLKVIRKTDRN